MATSAALQPLLRDGWTVRSSSQTLVQRDTADATLRFLLDTDQRKWGESCASDRVNTTTSGVLEGPVVLQVLDCTDVSVPVQTGSFGGNGAGRRIVRLKLTDGRAICYAVEYRRVSQITKELAPGTKIQLRNARIAGGTVLLEDGCCKVLGGTVPELHEQWAVARKYKNLQRPKGGEDGAVPPPFRPYRPGRRGAGAKGGRGGKEDAGAAAGGVVQDAEGGESIAMKALKEAAGAFMTATAAAGADGQREKRSVDVEGAAGLGAEVDKSAVKAKLQARVEATAAGGRSGDRFGRGGRRGRRGRDDDDDGPGGKTLEDWEAARRVPLTLEAALGGGGGGGGGAGPSAAAVSQEEEDRRLAEQLQRELDLEALEEHKRHRRKEERRDPGRYGEGARGRPASGRGGAGGAAGGVSGAGTTAGGGAAGGGGTMAGEAGAGDGAGAGGAAGVEATCDAPLWCCEDSAVGR
ncbi:unnamed protein product [Pedinophyceae sp. YPF-701]|nr:unnamed protein product [Pedinophyceae sp. YPF-701]